MLVRKGPDDPQRLIATVEADQRGDPGDAVARGEPRLLVDVDLGYTNLGVLAGESLEHRSDHVTRTAPVRPEVDDQRPRRLRNDRGERFLRQLLDLGHLTFLV